MVKLDRRTFLSAVAVGAVVSGFDPVARKWVSSAEAYTGSYEAIPHLDGALLTDNASRTRASTDVGNIIHDRPWAVLQPGSVEDVATMVCYCRRHDIKVAMRGQGHSNFGQSQAEGGLVVDTSTLATIHSIEPDRADVGAGVKWKDLLSAGVAQGCTPPILTAYTGLSIAGTLAMGGISTNHQHGTQVDHVRALQVVTGEGRIVWCSAQVHCDLFEAVLTGVGQFGIITRAVVDMMPAPARTKQLVLQYTNPAVFFRDLTTLLDRNEFSNVFGTIATVGMAVLPDPSALSPLLGGVLPAVGAVTGPLLAGLGGLLGGVPPLPVPALPWVYQINLAAHYTGASPNLPHMLRGMSDIVLLRQELDRTYTDFILRIDFLVDVFRAAGLWDGVPHLWIDNFLPGEVAPSFVPSELARLRFDDVGAAGLILLLPIRRSLLTRRYFPRPNGSSNYVFLFSIMTSAALPGENRAFIQQKLQRNRAIYERARAQGGKLYPISAVSLGPSDWLRQHGTNNYFELLGLKRRYDPSGILTPNVRMFPEC